MGESRHPEATIPRQRCDAEGEERAGRAGMTALFSAAPLLEKLAGVGRQLRWRETESMMQTVFIDAEERSRENGQPRL